MRIGRYRITRRGYLVFGTFGVCLLLLLAFSIKSIMLNATSEKTSHEVNQNEVNQVNDNDSTEAGTSETSTESTENTTTVESLTVTQINEIISPSRAIIYFKPDSYELDASYYPIMDEIVNTALRFKEVKIMIDGHYNGYPDFKVTEFWTSLAVNRAEMAEAYLVSQGIDQGRIKINNLGCSVPVNKDDSWQEIEKNRRVEIYFELLK